MIKISVALCTYNGETYLRKQLDSILNQTRPVDEIIICDDVSTDSTCVILDEYARNHPDTVRVIQNDQNLKAVKNFEKAIRLCTGDVIFLSDQDDIWHDEKVARYLTYLNDNPSVDIVCSNGYIIDNNGTTLDSLTVWDAQQMLKDREAHIDYTHAIYQCGNIATGASMALRRKSVLKMLPVPDTREELLHDEWFALLSSYQGSLAMIDQKLFYYRIHAEQQVGGVSYLNTPEERERLYNKFSINNKSLPSIKQRIKRVALLHNILSKTEESPLQNTVLRNLKTNYSSLKKQLIIYHPVLGRATVLVDKLINKRQLQSSRKKR